MDGSAPVAERCTFTGNVVVDMGAYEFRPASCLGDMNCTGGAPEFTDISYFVAAIGSESAWWQYYRDRHAGNDPPPGCEWLLGDYPGTPAGVEFQDIVPFANSIGQPCQPY